MTSPSESTRTPMTHWWDGAFCTIRAGRAGGEAEDRQVERRRRRLGGAVGQAEEATQAVTDELIQAKA